jgi:hypothetical protein
MKYKIFAIFDSKVGAFTLPSFCQTTSQAIRGFSDLVKDSGHAFSKHPADYTLFELGEYEDESGSFNGLSTPHSVSIGIDHVSDKL